MPETRPVDATFLQTIKAVLWSFFGVRKRSDVDAAPLKPAYIVVAALLAVASFVFILIAIVNAVVR